MEGNKSPSLKLKLHLFSSTYSEQRQDQRQLPVEEKKDGSLSGPPTYASGLTTERNPYSGKIKPAKFCKRLDQAKHFFKWKCDEQSEDTTVSQTRRTGPSDSRVHGAFPAETIAPRKERVDKSCKGEPVMISGSVPKNTKDTPRNCARERPEKMERSENLRCRTMHILKIKRPHTYAQGAG